MRGVYFLVACACAAGHPLAAEAADYAKIDRTIAKEPAYKSKSPKYALLLFGPDAKVRVWVVLDGETVYLDRNADGDLTGKDERFDKLTECKDIDIADPDGKTTYRIIAAQSFPDGEKPPRPVLDVSIEVRGPVRYQQYGGGRLGDNPKAASIGHFHGPLAAGPITANWKVPEGLALVAGDEPNDLRALVGTMSAEAGCWVVVRSHVGEKSAFPAGVHPVVEIEFPPKTAGEKPVKKRYTLDKFC
jgi:hypothetical protein